jgi:predicted dehydrogenase
MEKGGIPAVVKDWREMLGRVDGVMIDHRHPAPHVEPARFFIERGVPVFVDKPFTYRLRDAKRLLDMAAKKRVPITTFSAIAIQPRFQKFKQKALENAPVRSFNSNGAVDIKSRWGGIFFYGIHQVDPVIEVLGAGVRSVFVHQNPPSALATMLYDNGVIATINCIKEGGGGFHWTACTDKGVLTLKHDYPTNLYLASARIIHDLIARKRNPFPRERMLAPVAVLEAMEKSIRTRRPVKVARF